MCSKFLCLHVNQGGNEKSNCQSSVKSGELAVIVPQKSAAFSLRSSTSSWFHWWIPSRLKCFFFTSLNHLWSTQRACRAVACEPQGRPSLTLDASFALLLTLSEMYRFLALRPADRNFPPWLWSVSVRWDQVRSQPHSRLSTRLADALFLSLGDERQLWLRANGFVCFIEKL